MLTSLIECKTLIKIYLENNTCKLAKTFLDNRLIEIEGKIHKAIAKKNVAKVKQIIGDTKSPNWAVSQLNYWKEKKLLLNDTTKPPTAKYNSFGNKVTSSDSLKIFILRHILKDCSNTVQP